MKNIKDLRTDYKKSELNVKDLTEEPITLFQQWLSEAITYSNDGNAFVLSTVNSEGVPSSRVLLLRGASEKGLSFFTNYSSRKSQEIKLNPNVCMNFFFGQKWNVKSELMVQLADYLNRNQITILLAVLTKVG